MDKGRFKKRVLDVMEELDAVRKTRKNDVNASLKDDAKDDVKDDVNVPLKNDVKDDVNVPLKNDVKDDVNVPLKDDNVPLKDDVNVPLKDDVKDNVNVPFKDDIKGDVNVPFKDDIKGDVNVPFKDDINVPLNDDVNINNISISKPITEDSYHLNNSSFLFSKASINFKSPIPVHNQLFIRLFPSDPVYAVLSTQYNYKFFNHNIPEIPNTAPTIDQLWHHLLVYRNELSTTSSKYPLINREPNTEFFTSVNENFASYKNAKGVKNKDRVPLYYYMYDLKNKKPLHVPVWEAKRMFCKMYENYAMNTKQCRSLIEIILKIIPYMNREFPIIIRGSGVPVDGMTKVTNLNEKYKDERSDFSPEYCLAEILIHYPDLKRCSWNMDNRKNQTLRDDLIIDSTVEEDH